MLAYALAALFAFVAAFWFFYGLLMIREILSLAELPPLEAADPPPRVSVIIAARDEESCIEATVRRLLDQTGVAIEVIVVSDRSKDGTAAILARLAAEDARVKPVRIDELPAGWLGKCHACLRGSEVASGQWLLFTDADVRMDADLIGRAVRLARRDRVQHVCMMFNAANATLSGRAAQLTFFLTAFVGEANGINRDRAGASCGIGAFNLVEAAAYRASGGHEPLRLTVLEDVRLGKILRRAGYRTRLVHGGNRLNADWCATAWSLVRLMEKNFFSAAHYSYPYAAWVITLILGVWSLGLIGPFTLTPAGIAAGVALCSTVVPAILLARRTGNRLLPALLVPLTWPILAVALANSAWATWRQGGVRWRDTFYPVALLREHNVR